MKNRINTLRNKKVLITGGKGFLGRSLVNRVGRLCADAHVYRDDVRNIAHYRKKYDIVCHLAALNKPDEKGGIGDLLDVNINGTLSVMRYCHKKGAHCVFASSSAVYQPTAASSPISEASPLRPASIYGASKMLAENICRTYAEDLGVNVIALRIFNIYGPSQNEPFAVPYILNRLSKNEPLSLRTPNSVRDFVYVEDVVNAFILACAGLKRGFLALNVGTGKGVDVVRVVREIASRIKVLPLFGNKEKQNCRRDYVIADIRDIARALGWKPAVTVEKGLELLCDGRNIFIQRERLDI